MLNNKIKMYNLKNLYKAFYKCTTNKQKVSFINKHKHNTHFAIKWSNVLLLYKNTLLEFIQRYTIVSTLGFMCPFLSVLTIIY